MPITNFPDYARGITDLLDALLTAGQVKSVDLQIDQRSMLRGFIRGLLVFEDDAELHFREYVDVTLDEPKLSYAYHYQDANQTLIFRYDNAAHRPPLAQPEHKHSSIGATVEPAPTLAQVIDEILKGKLPTRLASRLV
jgi:hypothetical protein